MMMMRIVDEIALLYLVWCWHHGTLQACFYVMFTFVHPPKIF